MEQETRADGEQLVVGGGEQDDRQGTNDNRDMEARR